jgi:hypothetical protein
MLTKRVADKKRSWRGLWPPTHILAISFLITNVSVAQSVRAVGTDVDVYDGFEGSTLSNVWDTSRFATGAVEMQAGVVRAGHGATMITVRSRDKFEAGASGNSDSERAELLEARALTSKEHAAYEYSFSIFFPASFPIVPTRLVIAQWKQYCPEDRICSDDSPVLAIRYMSGVLRITQDIGKKQAILYQEKGDFRGRWLDFRFQVRFSNGSDGRIKAWLGDHNLVDYAGATANGENSSTGYQPPGYFYFKMGLYRNAMAEPMTLYIDEYRKKSLPGASF